MKHARPPDPATLLPLSRPALYVLLVLAGGERHGYAIRREVAQHTDSALTLQAGALYGTLEKLLAEGLIDESETRPEPHLDDSRRRYYRLTALGRSVVREETARLRALVAFAEARLGA